MPHLHRFYIAPDTPVADEITLPAEEAHHALRVVRLRPGERVALFDGEGREALGRVTRADKAEVVITVESERREPKPSAELTLIQAWLKRDRHIEEIIRHGAELGVATFLFFRAQHSEKMPKPDPKWTRLAIEACKQCGRLWLPKFAVADSLQAALEGNYETLLLATRDLKPAPLDGAIRGSRVGLIVGPEGDFTSEELKIATSQGARAISIGQVTFRSEIAAIISSALVLYEMGLLGPRTSD